MSEKIVEFHPNNPEIVVGAIITAYHKGYHKVIRVFEQHPGYNNDPTLLVEYYQVVTAKGTKSRGKTIRTCHVDFCELVDPNVILSDGVRKIHIKYDNLVDAINES